MPNIGLVPNPSIAFTDGTGPAVLAAIFPVLENWIPDAEDIGPSEVAMGTGQTFKYIYRTDYTATFDMSHLPAADMPVILRLKRWLGQGGQVVVNTQDLFANTYTCIIKPKGKLGLKYDRKNIEYTLSLQLLNTASAQMLCQYKSALGSSFTITVSPSPLFMSPGTGSVVPLTAVVTDGAGNVVFTPVQFASTNPSVAQVDANGNVTAIGAGSCAIVASAGGTSTLDPVTVSVNQTAANVTLSPSPLAFTATTYTGTPQVGVSGVPAQTITAVVTNAQGTVLPYTPGLLAWTSDSANVVVTDNNDGTASVVVTAGSLNKHVTAKVVLTPTATATVSVTSVAGGTVVTLVPSQGSITLTTAGQGQALTVTPIDQYGVLAP